MIREDLLFELGYSSNFIDNCIYSNSFKRVDGKLLVLNYDVYTTIFMSSLAKDNKLQVELINSIDEEFYQFLLLAYYYLYHDEIEKAKFFLDYLKTYQYESSFLDVVNNILSFVDDDLYFEETGLEYIDYSCKLISKYYKLKQYSMCSLIFDEIIKVANSPYMIMYKNIFDSLDTKTKYVIDTDQVLDEVTLNGIHKFERKLLYDLEFNDYKSISEDLSFLNKIYVDKTFCNIVSMLLMILKKIMENPKMISNHNLSGAYGSFRDIVLAFLKENDIYRSNELINKYYNKEHFVIEVAIYKCIMDKIMTVLKRNERNVRKEIDSSLTLDNEEAVITHHPISRISIENIKNAEETVDDVDVKHNYYKLYLDYYNDGDYINAKKALIRFKRNMKAMFINKDVEYLLSELEVLIENSKDSILDRSKYESMISKAKKESMDGNYLNAINYIKQADNYCSVSNPRNIVWIATLYYENNDLINAYNKFIQAEESFLYPEDYIPFMEVAFKLNRFDVVLDCISKYNYYYPEENTYVYYIQSLVYAKIGNYEEALSSISMIESINVVLFNIAIPLDYERKVLNDLKNGEMVDLYTLNDYYNYGLTDEEINIEEEVVSLEEKYNDSLVSILRNKDLLDNKDINDRIDYLITVLKIFSSQERYGDCEELSEYLNDLLDENHISNDKKNETIKILNRYSTVLSLHIKL